MWKKREEKPEKDGEYLCYFLPACKNDRERFLDRAFWLIYKKDAGGWERTAFTHWIDINKPE